MRLASTALRRRGAPIALVVLFLLFYLILRGGDKPLVDEFAGASFKRTIVAIGDIHSYYPNALKALQLADVVDSSGKWTGKVDILAQTGDLVDRGEDTIKVYELFDRLREESRRYGGRVVSHLGNHEYMNLIGDWRYVYQAPSDIKSFGSVEDRQRAFSSQGWIGQTLSSNYTVTSRVPLHPSTGADPYVDFDPTTRGKLSTWDAAFSFVHGGIHPSLPFTTPYPSRINELGRTLVRKLTHQNPLPQPHPPGPYPGLPQGTSQQENELYGVNGPVWFRGWAQDAETEQFCKLAKETMGKMGVRRMIMGHTPTLEHMVSRCDGSIIIIDTGITPAYGGVLSALKIEYGLFPAQHTPLAARSSNSSTSSILRWRELEVVRALYENSSDELARIDRIIEGDFS